MVISMLVKIRPIRYGNLLPLFSLPYSFVLLKSDRFGMET